MAGNECLLEMCCHVPGCVFRSGTAAAPSRLLLQRDPRWPLEGSRQTSTLTFFTNCQTVASLGRWTSAVWFKTFRWPVADDFGEEETLQCLRRLSSFQVIVTRWIKSLNWLLVCHDLSTDPKVSCSSFYAGKKTNHSSKHQQHDLKSLSYKESVVFTSVDRGQMDVCDSCGRSTRGSLSVFLISS